MEKQDYIDMLNKQFSDTVPESILHHFLDVFGDRIALASSLSLEDQVLTDMICSHSKKVRIFTLDTGRLFPETYSLIERTNQRYGISIEVYFPDFTQVEKMVRDHGINLFYESEKLRRECCRVRKIEPLQRAFEGLEVWICGLRKEQSVTRRDTKLVEFDKTNGLIKLNPLIGWSEKQVRDYVRDHGVPYNKLHDQGFPSIGCQPCTRAVLPGEDIRAGRWWWENPDHKECGLHRR